MSQSQCGRSPSQVGYDRGLGEPLPHQLANAPRVHPSATPESAFHSYAMRHKLLCGISTCFQVLSPLMGRLPTCYSPSATPLSN